MNNFSKMVIRKTAGFCIAFPFFAIFNILRLFIVKESSLKCTGFLVKHYVAVLAELTLIPKINDSAKFDVFINKMKRNTKLLKPLYDITVFYEDNNKIVLNYTNCPHCEAFISLGLRDLCIYACDSDWIIANRNSEKWDFSRNHQIGTGDNYCDHTYIRKPQ
jgi:hypothetical protein